MNFVTDTATVVAAIMSMATVGWGVYSHFFLGSVLKITLYRDAPVIRGGNWVLSIANKGRIKTTISNCFIYEYDYHKILRTFNYNRHNPKAIPKKGTYLPIEIAVGETKEIKFNFNELSGEYDEKKYKYRYLAIFDSHKSKPRLIRIKY